jgi:hypothetical protein
MDRNTPIVILNIICDLLGSIKIFLSINHYFRKLMIKKVTSLTLIPLNKVHEEMQIYKSYFKKHLPSSILESVNAISPLENNIIIPNNTMFKIINTFVNVKKLSIFNFSVNEESHINEFIKSLSNNDNKTYMPLFHFGVNGFVMNYIKNSLFQKKDIKHPLHYIKKLVFEELKYSGDAIIQTQELNRKLLTSLIHKNLESVTIKIQRMSLETTTNADIQLILDNCLGLRKFNLEVYYHVDQPKIRNQIINISFAKSINLVSIKMKSCDIKDDVICTMQKLKLQTLKFTLNDYLFKHYVNNNLYLWNGLKRLEHVFIPSRDQLLIFSKNFPHLEILNIQLEYLEKLNILGQYCPNIKILLLYYNSGRYALHGLKDDKINSLTSTLPNLKALMFTSAKLITDVGVEHIVNNCPNLQVLDMFLIKVITKKSYVLLVEKCKKLKVLGIQYATVVLEDIEYLINNIKELVWLNCYFERNIHEDNMKILRSKYPHMIFNNENIRDISTIKKYIT